jgi:glycosyltransferase involved in cell wall biosynthesis
MTGTAVTHGHPMISVILPVFNVAAYIQECLDCITNQDFSEEFEVILIDDCSTDNSADICRQWVQRSPRKFRLIENEQNLGVSATRNNGLDEAAGKYFMFVDPDDLLPTQALSALYHAAERSGVDIVKGNNTIFDESRENAARYNVKSQSVVSNDQVLTTLYEHDKVRGHPWGKLFRREPLGGYRFPVGIRMAQDLYYCSEVFSHATSLLLLNQDVYRYRNRDSGSTGSKFVSGAYVDWLDAVENTARFANSAEQLRAHKGLLVRTMTQFARECRKLPSPQAEELLLVIERRRDKWGIRLTRLILHDKLGPRSIARYLKMRQAIRATRGALARSE